jgi:hypothetical protein
MCAQLILYIWWKTCSLCMLCSHVVNLPWPIPAGLQCVRVCVSVPCIYDVRMYVSWCFALCIRVNMLVYRIHMVCNFVYTFCLNGALTADRTLPYQIVQACTAAVPVGRAYRTILKVQLGVWCRTPSPIYVILPAISWHELYAPPAPSHDSPFSTPNLLTAPLPRRCQLTSPYL